MDRSDEVPCIFQIPMQYNDGRPVEGEKFIRYHDIFNRQFGGYTPLGKIGGGSWHGQVESAERYEIWVTPARIPILEDIIRQIGYELGQKEMFVIVLNAEVRRFDLGGGAGQLGVNA